MSTAKYPTLQQWKRQQLMLTLDKGQVDCPECRGTGCDCCDAGRVELSRALNCGRYLDANGVDLKRYATDVVEIIREHCELTGQDLSVQLRPFLRYCTAHHIRVDLNDAAYEQAQQWVANAGAFSAEQVMAVCGVRTHRARSIIKRLLCAEKIKPANPPGRGFFVSVGQ